MVGGGEGVVRAVRVFAGMSRSSVQFRVCPWVQGYLAHKKPPPPLGNHRTLGIGLL